MGVRFYQSEKCFCVNAKLQNETRLPKILQLLRLSELNKEAMSVVHEVIKDGVDRFHRPGEKLEAINVIMHRLPTMDDFPVNSKQYHFPEVHKDEIKKQIGEFLEAGYIRQSTSLYNTPVWFVLKKPDSHGNKRWRVVLDFRPLNDKTIRD